MAETPPRTPGKKQQPVSEHQKLLDASCVASSPLPQPKPQDIDTAEMPPRTPGKKQPLAVDKAISKQSGSSRTADLASMLLASMLPPSAVSPMRASPVSEHQKLLDASRIASSPLPKLKPQATDTAETPPRTPGKKQPLACKGGKAVTPPSAVPKSEAEATSMDSGTNRTADLASMLLASMLPPKVPAPKAKTKAKAKGQSRRKKGKVPEFPALPRSPVSQMDQPRRPQLPPKLPEDNYDISDREESSDEIPIEVDRSLKHVPGWVDAFEEKAIQQSDIEPDSVFGRGVPVCDIDVIFPDKLYRKVKRVKVARVRGSSCRWGPDRLKGSEIIEYAQKTGQHRRLSLFQRASLAAASARPAKRLRGGA